MLLAVSTLSWTEIIVAFFGFCGLLVTNWVSYLNKRVSMDNKEHLVSLHRKLDDDFAQRSIHSRFESKPQVLIVDDDEDDIFSMTRVLQQFDSEVHAVRDVSEAKSLIQARVGSGRGLPFDLALVDLRLSGGTDAGDVVDVFETFAPWVPLAVITGSPNAGLIEKISRQRPITFLMKPLDAVMTEKLFRQYHIPFQRV